METGQPEGNYYNKYESKNAIEQRLVRGYFSAIDALLGGLGRIPSVFDAGCGEGVVTRHIRDLLSPETMLASDISERLIAQNQASEHTTPPPKNIDIRYFAGSIYETGLESGSVELVCACEVLEHLDDPGRAFAELFRVSAKYVLITVPNEPVWRAANLLRGKYVRAWGNTPGHVQHFNRRSLIALARSASGGSAVPIACRAPFPWVHVLFQKQPEA